MKLVHRAEAQHLGPSDHRGGGIAFEYFLSGEDGAKDNYMLALVSTDSYDTPRHRHNFEQIRIMVKGRFGYGPEKVQEQGSAGYFPEGIYYTQKGEEPQTTLLLQVAGPSGSGYMSHTQMRDGVDALKARGSFHDGVFTYELDGARHNQDGYEAVWEHVNGRKIAYTKPRYDAPLIIWPERFEWVAEPGAPGAFRRLLGVFNERGLSLEQMRLDAGAAVSIGGADRTRLIYALEGEGTATPQGGEAKAWAADTAMELARGESVTLRAQSPGLFYVMGLPAFN